MRCRLRLWARGAGPRLAGAGKDLRRAAAQCISGPRLLVAIGLLSVCGFLAADGCLSMWWIAAGTMCGGILGCAARRWKAAVLLALLPLAASAYCALRAPRPQPGDLSGWIGSRQVIFQAKVVSALPSSSPDVTRLLLACHDLLFPYGGKLCGRTILRITGRPPAVQDGDEIKATARVYAPPFASYSWDFDYAAYLRRQRVFCLCSSAALGVKVLSNSASKDRFADCSAVLACLQQWLAREREQLSAVHRKFAGEPEGDLLQSMVLGDRAVELSPDITRKFRELGLSHILAASGFNITVVTAVTWWLGRFILRSVLALNLLCFLTMLLYVGLAGPSPSVVRAALMCSCVLLSRCLFRSLYVPSALSLALLLTLVIDPASISDVGLQLSYVATAGIVCGARTLAEHISNPAGRKLPAWLSESLSVAMIAQASVLPIQLTWFWQIGLFFLPANVLVSPIVTIVTILGFFSSALIMVDWFGILTNTVVALIDRLTVYPIKLMIAIVNLLSACDEAKLHLGPPASGCVAAYYACLALLFLSLRLKRFRAVSLFVFVLALTGILWRPAPPEWTLAVFARSIVLMDSARQAVCLGDAGSGRPYRFILYSGARIATSVNHDCRLNRAGDGLILLNAQRLPHPILIVDGGKQPLRHHGRLPLCSLVVITGPSGGEGPYRPAGLRQDMTESLNLAGKAAGEQDGGLRPEMSLPYSNGPPDIPGIVDIVRESGCRLVVVPGGSWRHYRHLSNLAARLNEITGIRVLRMARVESILIARNCSGSRSDFWQVYSQAELDRGARKNN